MITREQRGERSSLATTTPSSRASTRPDEAVSAGAHQVAAALAEAARTQGRDEWLGVVGDCQSMINTLTAVQDAAIAEAARRESVWCEDGTLGQTVHAPGRVTLDAADLVAPVIGASHAQAQRRVEQAVRLATGRVPVPAEDRDVPEASGLGRLHEAMAAGDLDSYRAGVIAFELQMAPADVADAIVTALGNHLREEAATLRRRARVLLNRISPELLRERAKRARAATGLRRWVAEPGVDEWHGTFPSEDAAAAWAAIDRLAHDLVASGTCSNIEQARGKALTDLVTSNATVDVQVVLTVPADVDCPVTAAATTNASMTSPPDEGSTSSAHAHSMTTAVADQTEGMAVDALNVPSDSAAGTGGHDDDLVEVQGARPSEPLLVRRAWLRDHLPKAPAGGSGREMRDRPRFVLCDPLTGARLDPRDHLATDAYRPTDELATLVRARDGRCRFPGCSIAARFCDLDHVRPWPTGPTSARNLLTVCRRHHRIKQRPGWQLRLAPDGTATWSGPSGRERTTAPLNALHSLVLRADSADGGIPVESGFVGAAEPMATAERQTVGKHQPGGEQQAWSALETSLGFRLEHHPHSRPQRDPWTGPTHRRCTSAAGLRAGFSPLRTRAPIPDLPPF